MPIETCVVQEVWRSGYGRRARCASFETMATLPPCGSRAEPPGRRRRRHRTCPVRPTAASGSRIARSAAVGLPRRGVGRGHLVPSARPLARVVGVMAAVGRALGLVREPPAPLPANRAGVRDHGPRPRPDRRPGRQLALEGRGRARDLGRARRVRARAGRANPRGRRERLARAPWPTGWEKWRPDPAWELPELPDGWDVRQ